MWPRRKQEHPPFSQLADTASVAEPALAAFPSFGNAATALVGTPESSLRTTVKNRLLNDMICAFGKERMGVVMCVDGSTMRSLSAVFRMSELTELNVHLVDNITMKTPNGEYLRRQPMPDMTAVYYITPTVESVNRLIADFRDKKKPMYGTCHLFFSSPLSDALFIKIKAAAVIGRVAGLKELNLEMVCSEPNAFTFDSPQSLPSLFTPDESPASSEGKLQEQHRLAAMLTTLFATLGEMPHIRHSSREVAASVASILHTKLNEMARPGGTFPSRILTDAEKPTLLLLDRSSDLLS